MVGDWGDSDAHHTPAQVRQDAEHEHDGVLFSNKYAGRGDLFEGLDVWSDEKYRQIRGTYPVIFMSFAGIKAANITDIYNPWSISSFIKKDGRYAAYWTNTNSNSLINFLIQTGNREIKQTREILIKGGSFEAMIDEQIVFSPAMKNILC